MTSVKFIFPPKVWAFKQGSYDKSFKKGQKAAVVFNPVLSYENRWVLLYIKNKFVIYKYKQAIQGYAVLMPPSPVGKPFYAKADDLIIWGYLKT